MNVIKSALLSLLQLGALVVAYQLLAAALVVGLRPWLPVYDEYNAVGDATTVLVMLLLWDRFFGPYSFLLRGVARKLRQAEARKEIDYDVV